MAKFNFNLEAVLSYRKNLEDTAKENLAASLAFYQQEKNTLNQIEDKLAVALEPMAKAKLNLDQLLHQESYQLFLSERKQEQRIKVNSAKGTVVVRRRELEKKMQDRKIIENLKEKRYQEHLYHVDMVEQKAIDDMAVNGFIRQNRENKENF